MKKPLPPIQSEIEAAQRDLFKSGDIKAVAAHLDRDQSYVSHLLSPEKPENKSPLYVLERFVYACDQERTELGDEHVLLFLTHRSRWLNREAEPAAVPPEVPQTMFDYLQSAIQKLPYGAQMQYLDKCYLTLDKFKRGLHFKDIDDSELEDNVQSIKRK